MAKFHDEWVVGPHGPLEALEPNLLSVTGEIVMPLGRFPRRMTVIGLSERRTAIWSPVPLREASMREIETLGAPAFLIVPGVAHRLDIRAWRARYPQAKVLCAPGAREAVSEAVPVDATSDVINEPGVRFASVPGTGEREAALLVANDRRVTLIVNDVLANVRHPPGLGAQIMARLFGFGVHGPRVPRNVARAMVEDRAALAKAFADWAKQPGLVRVIVSHGDIIAPHPAAALRRAAADFA